MDHGDGIGALPAEPDRAATASQPSQQAVSGIAGIPSALCDLAGEGIFEIVPRLDIQHPFDPDATGVVFTLNNRTYLVFEDPNDGYRSSASPLLSFAGSAYELGGTGPSFPIYIREAVICSHRIKGRHGDEDDVLEVRSKETGEIIFEVGTEAIDDYYPGYVCRWCPENLSFNAKNRDHD